LRVFRIERGHRTASFLVALLGLVLIGSTGCSTSRVSHQQSLDEWRALTAAGTPTPRVFLKGEQVRFYFPRTNGVEAFKAHWSLVRIPSAGYKVRSAMLRWDQKLSRIPEHDHGWREARLIGVAEWRTFSTNLIAELTPETPGHGAYYQAFLADGVLYRDQAGAAHFVPLGEQPKNIVIDHQFSAEETLEQIARLVSTRLESAHPNDALFLLMAPSAKRITQPVLVDRRRRRCVLLMPAPLYDWAETCMTPSITARSLIAILPESHGIALLKNPISSAMRLMDLAVASVVRFVRLPLPKAGAALPEVHGDGQGMNLAAWEEWLDHCTGTRRQPGNIELLIDGEIFYNRFHQAVDQATNHIHIDVYIFDRDDVAVKVADHLKARAKDIEVKVLLDQMGSIGAGLSPPSTPLPENFEPPASIVSYLREDSDVELRKFLNPWFSSDHEKVFLMDGATAFCGGMNFGREYRYEWHDLMVELHGTVVQTLEQEFERKWAHASWLGDLAYAAVAMRQFGEEPVATNSAGPWIPVRLLPTKTAWKPFSTAVGEALHTARNYIYAENPYLFDKRMIIARVRARKRGVDVRVVLPRVNDFKAGGRGNLVIANYLLANGVRVYFYPGMTHVKALMVDGWSCVGTGNLNHLSLRVNQEQNIATSDPDFAARLKHDLFEEDFARSHRLTEPVSVDWVDFLADFLLEGF